MTQVISAVFQVDGEDVKAYLPGIPSPGDVVDLNGKRQRIRWVEWLVGHHPEVRLVTMPAADEAVAA